MAYKDVLTKVIKESKLSLREISARCETIGVSISPSYISQIQTGKLPPPSEEISKAIAQVCKINEPTELIFEGYMEKAPELIRYYLTVTSETNNQLLKIIMPVFHPNIDEAYIEKMDTFLKLESTISYLERLKRKIEHEPFFDLYRIIKEKLHLDNSFDEMQQIFMDDSSMEPLIAKNSKLQCIFYRDKIPQDKDIVAFMNRKTKIITARRYYKHDDIITLVPENKEYDIIYIKDIRDVSLYGKVVSFTTSINYQ